MWRWFCGGLFVFAMFRCGAAVAGERPVEWGTVIFKPSEAESSVVERFRLQKGAFEWQARRMETVTETIEVWDVTFPSPVKTPEELNNTVHGAYYRSRLPGRRP